MRVLGTASVPRPRCPRRRSLRSAVHRGWTEPRRRSRCRESLHESVSRRPPLSSCAGGRLKEESATSDPQVDKESMYASEHRFMFVWFRRCVHVHSCFRLYHGLSPLACHGCNAHICVAFYVRACNLRSPFLDACQGCSRPLRSLCVQCAGSGLRAILPRIVHAQC